MANPGLTLSNRQALPGQPIRFRREFANLLSSVGRPQATRTEHMQLERLQQEFWLDRSLALR